MSRICTLVCPKDVETDVRKTRSRRHSSDRRGSRPLVAICCTKSLRAISAFHVAKLGEGINATNRGSNAGNYTRYNTASTWRIGSRRVQIYWANSVCHAYGESEILPVGARFSFRSRSDPHGTHHPAAACAYFTRKRRCCARSLARNMMPTVRAHRGWFRGFIKLSAASTKWRALRTSRISVCSIFP